MNCETNFNYEKQPDFPFSFEHTGLRLTAETDTTLVKGVVNYVLSAKSPTAGPLVLNAKNLAVEAAALNGRDSEFSLTGDSLIIPLADSLQAGGTLEVGITWQAATKYGLHQNYKGTVWSSLNPKALRHWLPVFDHPSAESPVEAAFTIPADDDLIFNGTYGGDEIVSAETKTVYWSSAQPLPLTGLTFAAGKFTADETRQGNTVISIFTEENTADREEADRLLFEAAQTVKAAEEALGTGFPFETLHIVVLENSYWEEKQSGAGFIYLYTDLGSLHTQLKRGIYDQWFGQVLRTENFAEGAAESELIKAALLFMTGNEPEMLENPDSLESLTLWNGMQGFLAGQNSFYRHMVQQSAQELLRQQKGVVRPEYFSDYRYRQTGLNVNIEAVMPHDTARTAGSEGFRDPVYQADAEYDEISSQLSLHFKSLSGDVSILSGLTLNIHTLSGVEKKEISFTGESDEITLEVPVDTEFITLSSGVTDIKNIEPGRFPVLFLINQLYSAEAEDRKTAALQLSYHTDNPDLQLAVGDVLKTETNPSVTAALLSTYGMITAGDKGTEQVFLKELRNPDEEIQLAAVRALGNYPENEQVLDALQGVLTGRVSDAVFGEALISYQLAAPEGDWLSLSNALQRTDSTGRRAAEVLFFAAEQDMTDEVLEAAENLLFGKQPFAVRLRLLHLILENNTGEAYLKELLPGLLRDGDPRIRSGALHALLNFDEKTAESLAAELLKQEYDPRVFKTLIALEKENS